MFFFFLRLLCHYICNYFPSDQRLNFLHFSNTQTYNAEEEVGEWSKERKKIPNENPAENLYTVFYCLQRERGGSSKSWYWCSFVTHPFIPHSHLVYCFAYVHNQYLNEWMEAYEAQSSKMLYFNSFQFSPSNLTPYTNYNNVKLDHIEF